MKKIVVLLLRGAVLAGLAVLFFLAPPALSEALGKNVHVEWLTADESEWKGVLRLWNVYDGEFRFDQSVLKETVESFEEQNHGIFIEYITLPLSGVESRLARQSPPDLWIYPQGRLGVEEHAVLQVPKPPEENVLTEEFEFDIESIGSDEVVVEAEPSTLSFSVSYDLQGEALKAAGAFVAQLAKNAGIDELS